MHDENHTNMRIVVLCPQSEFRSYLQEIFEPFPFLQLIHFFDTSGDLISNNNNSNNDVLIIYENSPNVEEIISFSIDSSMDIIYVGSKEQCFLLEQKFPLVITLVKGFDYKDFIQTIFKLYHKRSSFLIKQGLAIKSTRLGERFLFIKTGNRIIKTSICDILFFEKQGNYFSIHCKDGVKLLYRITFSELEKKLPPGEFLRVHNSYLISVRHIDIIEGTHVVIQRQSIPVSTKYKSMLMDIVE